MEINSIVASGMQAMRLKADAHAHNVANALTPGYKRLAVGTTERPQGGVGLSVEREPSRMSIGARDARTPASADDLAPAGNPSPPGRVDGQVASEVPTGAEGGAVDEVGSSSRNDEAVALGANADPVTDMIGMTEAARGMDMLAAVYRRHDEALGSLIDAFG